MTNTFTNMTTPDVNTCPVFVSSSDAYADIWPAFFAIFKREWPEFHGAIYLNTESKSYTHSDLNIISTQVGKYKHFGQTFKAGLSRIPSDTILLIMIDYFFEQRVNTPLLQSLYSEFTASNIDTLTLFNQPLTKSQPVPSCDHCREITMPDGGGEAAFSFQTAFWKKSSLRKFIADWETPWMAEYYGCRRVKYIQPRIWVVNERKDMPIIYDGLGVLHGRGRWLESAVAKIDLNGIPLDYEASKKIRGVFHEPTFPRLVRIPYELKHMHLRALSRLSTLFRHIPG